MGTCCSKADTAVVGGGQGKSKPTPSPSGPTPSVPPHGAAANPLIKQEKDKAPVDNNDTIPVSSRNDPLERIASDEITHSSSIGDLSDSSSGARVSGVVGDRDPLELGTLASSLSSTTNDDVGCVAEAKKDLTCNLASRTSSTSEDGAVAQPKRKEKGTSTPTAQGDENGRDEVCNVAVTSDESKFENFAVEPKPASPSSPVSSEKAEREAVGGLPPAQESAPPGLHEDPTTSAVNNSQLESGITDQVEKTTPAHEEANDTASPTSAADKAATLKTQDREQTHTAVTEATLELKQESNHDEEKTSKLALPTGLAAMAAAAKKVDASKKTHSAITEPTKSTEPASPVSGGVAAMAAAAKSASKLPGQSSTPGLTTAKSSNAFGTGTGGLAAMAQVAAARRKEKKAPSSTTKTAEETTTRVISTESAADGGGLARLAAMAAARRKESPTPMTTLETTSTSSKRALAGGGGGLAAMAAMAAARRKETPTPTTTPETTSTSCKNAIGGVVGSGGLAAMAAMASARKRKESPPSRLATEALPSSDDVKAVTVMAASKRNKQSPPTQSNTMTETTSTTSTDNSSQVTSPASPPPSSRLGFTAAAATAKKENGLIVNESSPTTVTSTPTTGQSVRAMMAAKTAEPRNKESTASPTTATTALDEPKESNVMISHSKPCEENQVIGSNASREGDEDAYESSVVSSSYVGYDRDPDELRMYASDNVPVEYDEIMFEHVAENDDDTWMGLDPPVNEHPETFLMKMKFLRDSDDVSMEDVDRDIDDLDPPDTVIEDSFGLELDDAAESCTDDDERSDAMETEVDEADVLEGTTHTLDLEDSVHCEVGIKSSEYYSTVDELDPPQHDGLSEDEDGLVELLPEKYRYQLDPDLEEDESTNMSFVLGQLEDAETADIVESLASTKELEYAPTPVTGYGRSTPVSSKTRSAGDKQDVTRAEEGSQSRYPSGFAGDELDSPRAEDSLATSTRETTSGAYDLPMTDGASRTKFARRSSEPWSLDVSTRSMLVESRNDEEDFVLNRSPAMGGPKADEEAALDVVLGRRGRSTYYQPSLDDEILTRNIRSTYYQPSLDEVMTRIISRSTYKDPIGDLSHRSVEGRRALYIHFGQQSAANVIEEGELSDLE